MYAVNTPAIRMATPDDAVALHRLAQLDSATPLTGAVLVAEADGEPVAAVAVADGRTIADPFVPTAPAVVALRARAQGLRAVERTPSLRERLRAAVPVPTRTHAADFAA